MGLNCPHAEYGNWQNNLNGGTLESVADSNCLFSVADITVTSS